MILESTQILCTVLAKTGVDTPYRPTHKNHPCTLWAEESLDNWLWLLDLTMALNSEYMYRFNRKTSHKSAIVAQSLVFPEITPIGLTERPQAMPEKYRIPDDPVSAYRQYYLAEKIIYLNIQNEISLYGSCEELSKFIRYTICYRYLLLNL